MQINKNKNLKFGIIFLVAILFVLLTSSFISAISSYQRSSSQYISPGAGSIGYNYGANVDLFPYFDETSCVEGQDFVIQVAPFGCEPSVVRSDLLEEQNVPVFCQLAATKLNPLIDVEAIDSISFSGDYPEGVSGVGFHPARAAVKGSYKTLLNSPVLANIGYAVVVLEKQKNESSMPDSINGTLTAKIRYDIKNAFGTGKAVYYLPEITDDEWGRSKKYKQYGFWQGRGFLRAESIDENSAVIGIYRDEDTRISTVNVKKGETSRNIYLPGFYCRAGLQVRLNDLENPDTRAKLKINGEIIEVGKGEKFLENKCQVKDIDKKGLVQEVKIRCNSDEDPSDDFTLRISPRVEVTVNGVPKTVTVGEKLYDYESREKSVYLGYLGEDKDGDKFIIPVTSTKFDPSEFKKSTIFKALPTAMKSFQYESGSKIIDFFKAISVVYSGGILGIADFLITGDYPVGLLYNKDVMAKKGKLGFDIETVYSYYKPLLVAADISSDEEKLKQVIFLGIAEPEDIKLPGEVGEYYNNSVKDYRTVIDSFPNEKEDQVNRDTLGEKALFKLIELSEKLGQKKTILEYCDEFEERYPESDKNLNDYCKDELKLSNSGNSNRVALIDGNAKDISLENINEPTKEEYSAEINVAGERLTKSEKVTLRKNQIKYFEVEDKIQDYVFSVAKEGPTKYNSQVVYFRYRGEWQYSAGNKVSWDDVSKIDYTDRLPESPLINYLDLIGKLETSDFEEGRDLMLGKEHNGKEEDITSGTLFIQLDSLEQDSAKIRSNLFSGTRRIKLDTPESFGEGYIFTLTNVNLKKQAKVSVIPNIHNTETKANFTFDIGIEKRAIQLSPERIKKKLKDLNESIKKWDNIAENLAKTVKGFSAACLVTSASLLVKNFFGGLEGKASARHDVTQTYRDKCNDEIKAKKLEDKDYKDSLDSCLVRYGDYINSDVERLAEIKTNLSKSEFTDKDLCTTRSSDLLIGLGDGNSIINPQDKNEKINLSDINSAFEGKEEDGGCTSLISTSEAERIELHNKIINDESLSSDIRNATKIERYQLLSDIEKDYGVINGGRSMADELGWNYEDVTVGGAFNKERVTIPVTNLRTVKEANEKYFGIDPKYDKLFVRPYKDDLGTGNYLFIVDADGVVQKTYKYAGAINEKIALVTEDEDGKILSTNPFSFKFDLLDPNAYKNPYRNPEVIYWETGSNKGNPSIVPVDTKEGWYAATRSLSLDSMDAYTDSGMVSFFFLCNVMGNGKPEFGSGVGDDKCTGVNTFTKKTDQTLEGLTPTQTNKLASKAIQCITDASRSYKAGVKGEIRICGENIPVGPPQVNLPGTQCQDFMSPEDCGWLFNVCDPVVCPSSRCDFGGSYPVADVVQSGVVGSAALCLPNFGVPPEGVAVPVCLSGLNAGVESWVSILHNYRDCLQENLETGQTVGVCDELHSIYLCEFFWRQALPLSDVYLPKVAEFVISGGKLNGGGEYLKVQEAWDNADKSLNFMVDYYGKNSYEAFKAETVSEIGTSVCKASASARYPSSGSFFDALIEPRSPTQFSAWFHEIPFTDATVPPVSQYKVFFHIYAGKENGAYYNVYLKSPEGSSYYYDNPTITVKGGTGYIPKGGYASETVDFTAPTGYQKLCVNVNGQEECGFKQVSTSAALNYVADEAVKDQFSRTDIDDEKECISGSPSSYGLLTPNIQEGVQTAIDPELYKRGIIRVCSTENPGKGTDPNAGGQGERWIDVGYCGDEKITCWLDKKSVEDTVIFDITAEEGLEKVKEDALEKIRQEGNYLSPADFEKLISIEGSIDVIKSITDEVIEKALFANEKARLYFKRAIAYGDLAVKNKPEIPEKEDEELEDKAEFIGVGEIQLASLTDFTEEQQDAYREWLKNNEGDYNFFKLEHKGEGEEKKTIMYVVKKGNEPDISEVVFDVGGNDITNEYDGPINKVIEIEEREVDEESESVVEVNCNEECGRDISPYTFGVQNLCDRDECESLSSNCEFTPGVLRGDAWGTCNEGVISGDIIIGENPFEYSEDYDASKVLSSDEVNYHGIVEDAAERFDVNFNLIRAVIMTESSWDPRPGPVGEQGLMQLSSDGAIKDMIDQEKGKCYDSCERYYDSNWKNDAKTNVFLGTCYLRCLYDVYEITDIELVIAAYNAGPGTVKNNCDNQKFEECKSDLPSSTVIHVDRFLNHYDSYSD